MLSIRSIRTASYRFKMPHWNNLPVIWKYRRKIYTVIALLGLALFVGGICVNGIDGIDLPDQEGEVDGSFGEIEYKIQGMKMGFPWSYPSFDLKDGISLTFTAPRMVATGQWYFQANTLFSMFSMEDNGTFEATISYIIIEVNLFPGTMSDIGSLVLPRCSTRVSAVDLKLEGGQSWLYDAFATAGIEDSIKVNLRTELTQLARTVTEIVFSISVVIIYLLMAYYV